MTDSVKPIVVGVDGSIGARHAARWAAALAARLGSPLQIVHATPYVGYNPTDAVAAFRAAVIEDQRDAAESILQGTANAVRSAHPDLDVTPTALNAPADAALHALSRHARLLVLGCGELSPTAAMLIGSLTLELTAQSGCPVIAWRGELLHPTTQPIVVGVDGSSSTALALAFELADTLGAPLWAVHAWSTWRPPGEVSIPFLIDWEQLETHQRKELTDAVEPFSALHPQVEVSLFVDPGKPRRALLQRLDGAQIVVVGSRGHSPLAAVMLGATSLNMLHHAPVPVVVCRPEPSDA